MTPLNSEKLRLAIIGVLLLALGGVVGFRYGSVGAGALAPVPLSQVINRNQPENRENVDFSVFWEVWDRLDLEYLDQSKLDARALVDGAVGGMTAAVGDPYTTYLPPVENEKSAQDLAGSFYGVGIELGYIDDTLAVVAPLKGTPAERAGIQAGDLIIHVRDEAKGIDEDSNQWALDKAVENIRGPKNSPIILTILRKDDEGVYGEPFDVEVTRGEVIVESVVLEFVEHDGKRVAHLAVSRFGDRTNGEFESAVGEILAKGAGLDGVVLDVRNNPGGYFDGAIDLASEFIEDGIVVSQQGRFTKQDFRAKGSARLKQFPVVVLVNRGSASASEILAGALRDQLGAELVGENTFGKGTVQDRSELSNGGGLHVTIARWLLPSGDSIQDEGIPVTVEVKDDVTTPDVDEALLRAIEEF